MHRRHLYTYIIYWVELLGHFIKFNFLKDESKMRQNRKLCFIVYLKHRHQYNFMDLLEVINNNIGYNLINSILNCCYEIHTYVVNTANTLTYHNVIMRILHQFINEKESWNIINT